MLLSNKQLVKKFNFHVSIDYSEGLEHTRISVSRLVHYQKNGINKVEDYNLHADLIEDLLQDIHDQSYRYGTYAIPTIVQFSKNKKIIMKVNRQEGITSWYEIEVKRSHLIKALDYDFEEIQDACEGAKSYLDSLNYTEASQYTPLVQHSFNEIERVLKQTYTHQNNQSLRPAIFKAYGNLASKYLNSIELNSITTMMREFYLNGSHVSVTVDRKNREYVPFIFDEAAMFLSIVHPSRVYIPQYDDQGFAKCRFFNVDLAYDKAVQFGFIEMSTVNYRHVVPYQEPRKVDMTNSKYIPCIGFIGALFQMKDLKVSIPQLDDEFIRLPSMQALDKIQMLLSNVVTV